MIQVYLAFQGKSKAEILRPDKVLIQIKEISSLLTEFYKKSILGNIDGLYFDNEGQGRIIRNILQKLF